VAATGFLAVRLDNIVIYSSTLQYFLELYVAVTDLLGNFVTPTYLMKAHCSDRDHITGTTDILLFLSLFLSV